MSQNLFLNPTVSSAPVLTGGSIGTGTLTIDKLTHFTINQSYTVVCTAITPFTVFDVIGSLDGPVGVAQIAVQFQDQDDKVHFTINQGPTLFEVGDTFNFTLAQGTDLTQENIDTYDELPQKNFGVGIVGQNAGDHNIRFNQTAQLAFRDIQDLKFESKLVGEDGNSISIQYLLGTLLTSAQITVQDITYTAFTQGIAGNDVQIEYIQFTDDVKASKQIQDVLYTSKLEGVLGNVTSVEYIGGGTKDSEGVALIGNKVQVTIEDGVSTADSIRIAIGGFPAAFALLDGISTGTGLETQTTQVETLLTGGLDAIGDAGNEVVTVLGDLVQVQLESGVSTAQQVNDAILASGPATAKLTPAITGGAATVQIAPVAATNLAGGTDALGDPGNEIVLVTDELIQITFVNNASTAAQIKTAVEASVPANALVTVTLIGTGQKETTDLDALQEADIDNGESFKATSANDVRTVQFYYRIDAVDLPPGSGDDVPIDILTGDNANTVATKSAATINAEPEWDVAVPALNTFRIINAAVGEAIDVVNVDVGVGQAVAFNITKILDGFDIGQELQLSPIARIFLGGGLGIGTYAFNTKELTDVGAFNEGNAAILVTGINNQGDETTQGEALKKGKVTLDDDIGANGSGPLVENLQETINDLIQNGKVLIYSANDDEVSWTSPDLTLTSNLVIHFSETNIKNQILQANSPITIADGEHLWVRVDRDNNADIAITVAATIPDALKGEDIYRIVSRVGTSLHWFDGTLQTNGKSILLGGGGASPTQEVPAGVIDGVNKDFVLSATPTTNSLKVLLDGLNDTAYTFDVPSKTITFTDAPVLGQDVYVTYWID